MGSGRAPRGGPFDGIPLRGATGPPGPAARGAPTAAAPGARMRAMLSAPKLPPIRTSIPALLLVLAASCAGEPPRAEPGDPAASAEATDAQPDATPTAPETSATPAPPTEQPGEGVALDGEQAASTGEAAGVGPSPGAAELPPAWREVDRVLGALGGREAWAELAGVELHGDTFLEHSEQPIPVSVWRDLEHGRVRIEQTFEGVKTVFGIDAERGWSLREGNYSEMTPERLATVRYEQARSPYRVLRALARREGVQPRLVDGGLEIYTEGDEGAFLCWLQVGPDGRPTQYGYGSNDGSADRQYFFDHWSETAGYLHPTHYSESSHGMRFQNRSFLPHTELNPELFQPPR